MFARIGKDVVPVRCLPYEERKCSPPTIYVEMLAAQSTTADGVLCVQQRLIAKSNLINHYREPQLDQYESLLLQRQETHWGVRNMLIQWSPTVLIPIILDYAQRLWNEFEEGDLVDVLDTEEVWFECQV